MRIPLAHGNTEPPQGMLNKDALLDIDTSHHKISQLAKMLHGRPPRPTMGLMKQWQTVMRIRVSCAW